MDDQLLKTLSDKELIEVVYNYEKFGYHPVVKKQAILEIESRNLSQDELERLEAAVLLEKEEGEQLVHEEFFLLRRLKSGLKHYYIAKAILSTLMIFGLTTTLLLRFLSIIHFNPVSIIVLFFLIYIVIEKPFRIHVIYFYENLRADLYPDETDRHWLQEIFYIMGGTVIPFCDLFYLSRYRRISESLITVHHRV